MQCVGTWATDKHHYLKHYIEATREVRRKYIQRDDGGEPGGAGFLDLFAGPGLARVRESGDLHPTSSLIALGHGAAPFTRVISCDIDADNVRALRARTRDFGARSVVESGDSNERVQQLVEMLPPQGLNLAFVDPFAVSALHFRTLRRLARSGRCDLLINFPTQDIRRNFDDYVRDEANTVLDRALGSPTWRKRIRGLDDVAWAPSLLVEALEKLGYTGTSNRTLKITNSNNTELYRLVFAAKHELADKIWASIVRNPPSGQREMF